MYTGALRYFEAHFRGENRHNFLKSAYKAGFLGFKRTRNTVNVDNSGCHGQFNAFYFI